MRFFIHANDEMLSHCLFTTDDADGAGGGGAGAGAVGTLAEDGDFKKEKQDPKTWQIVTKMQIFLFEMNYARCDTMNCKCNAMIMLHPRN